MVKSNVRKIVHYIFYHKLIKIWWKLEDYETNWKSLKFPSSSQAELCSPNSLEMPSLKKLREEWPKVLNIPIAIAIVSPLSSVLIVVTIIEKIIDSIVATGSSISQPPPPPLPPLPSLLPSKPRLLWKWYRVINLNWQKVLSFYS